jgi:hypothetical protein
MELFMRTVESREPCRKPLRKSFPPPLHPTPPFPCLLMPFAEMQLQKTTIKILCFYLVKDSSLWNYMRAVISSRTLPNFGDASQRRVISDTLFPKGASPKFGLSYGAEATCKGFTRVRGRSPSQLYIGTCTYMYILSAIIICTAVGCLTENILKKKKKKESRNVWFRLSVVGW